MRNLTVNETLLLSSEKEIDIPLFWGETLAIALLKRQSFLNVSRGNTGFYIFLLLVKNAFVCHGISNIMPLPWTLELLYILTGSRLVWPIQNNNLDLELILPSWAVVLYFGLGFSPLSATKSFLISLTVLTALPLFSPTHSFSEFIVDFFCIASLTWYILDRIWGRLEADIEWFVTGTTFTLLFLALDGTCGTRGLVFDIFLILNLSVPSVIYAFIERKLIHALVFTGIFIYCVYEKVNTHITRFQIQNWQILKHEDMIITGEDLEKIALQIFRF